MIWPSYCHRQSFQKKSIRLLCLLIQPKYQVFLDISLLLSIHMVASLFPDNLHCDLSTLCVLQQSIDIPVYNLHHTVTIAHVSEGEYGIPYPSLPRVKTSKQSIETGAWSGREREGSGHTTSTKSILSSSPKWGGQGEERVEKGGKIGWKEWNVCRKSDEWEGWGGVFWFRTEKRNEGRK